MGNTEAMEVKKLFSASRVNRSAWNPHAVVALLLSESSALRGQYKIVYPNVYVEMPVPRAARPCPRIANIVPKNSVKLILSEVQQRHARAIILRTL